MDAATQIKDWREAAAEAKGVEAAYRCPAGHVTEFIFTKSGPPLGEMPCTVIVDLERVTTSAEFLAAPTCGKPAARVDA